MDGDGEFYEVSDWMPDADDCYFDAMDGSYWCVWEVGPSKERSYYINLGRAVRGCYPDWKVENEHDVVFIESDSIGIYISREDGEVAISIESFQ